MPEKEENKSTIEDLTPTNSNIPILKSTTQKPTTKPIAKKIATKTIPQTSTAKNIPTPEASQKPIKKIKPTYKYAGRETLSEIIRKNIPKQFITTDRFATILGLIFLTIVVLALIQFPFEKLLSGDTDIIIGIGYPWPFLELEIENPEEPPVRYLNLFLDLILYLILSYAIDISINLITNTSLIKSKKKQREQPKIYKSIKPTLADKMTKKVFNEEKSQPTKS